jgi:hypothetical protein
MLGILERIRTKKREITQNTAEAYFQLVREVASGSEVDVESAALIIESAGKDDAAFETDVETQQERIGLSSQLKHKQQLQKQLPKLEQAERLAGEHYERVVSEASSRLNEAKRAARAVNSELLCLMQVEDRLRDSCLDQSLLTRERELMATKMALVQKRRPLDEDLSRSRNMVQSHQSSVDALNRKIADRNNDPVAKASYKKDLALNERALEREQNVARQLEQAIEDIDSELVPIDRELAEIRAKKLEV